MLSKNCGTVISKCPQLHHVTRRTILVTIMILLPWPIPFRSGGYTTTTGHKAPLTTFWRPLRRRFRSFGVLPAGYDGKGGCVAAVDEGSEGTSLEEEDDYHERDADKDHGEGKSPICGGDGEFCDSKDGLIMLAAMVVLKERG